MSRTNKWALAVCVVSASLVAACSGGSGNEPLNIPSVAASASIAESASASSSSSVSSSSTPVIGVNGFPRITETSTAEDIVGLYADKTATEELDPSLSAEEQAQKDQDYQKRLASVSSTEMEVNGVKYTVVSADNEGVLTGSPLRIAVVPGEGAKTSVKVSPPQVMVTSTSPTDSPEVIPVSCDPPEVMSKPVVVTCSFKGNVPQGSALVFGLVTDKGNTVATSIPLG